MGLSSLYRHRRCAVYGCRLGRRTGRRFRNASQIESFEVVLTLINELHIGMVAEISPLHSTSPNTGMMSDNVTTATPAPAVPTTLSSAVCPAVNGSTYTITNPIAPTARPYKQTMYSSLAYKILCDTNFSARPTVVDLQALSNTSPLGDCLYACALYSFQTPPYEFPAHICSGLAWESENNMCWLKSNISLSSTNQTSNPMPDAAVMITT